MSVWVKEWMNLISTYHLGFILCCTHTELLQLHRQTVMPHNNLLPKLLSHLLQILPIQYFFFTPSPQCKHTHTQVPTCMFMHIFSYLHPLFLIPALSSSLLSSVFWGNIFWHLSHGVSYHLQRSSGVLSLFLQQTVQFLKEYLPHDVVIDFLCCCLSSLTNTMFEN